MVSAELALIKKVLENLEDVYQSLLGEQNAAYRASLVSMNLSTSCVFPVPPRPHRTTIRGFPALTEVVSTENHATNCVRSSFLPVKKGVAGRGEQTPVFG